MRHRHEGPDVKARNRPPRLDDQGRVPAAEGPEPTTAELLVRSKVAGKENLFPAFTTLREKIGEHWFPLSTHADDTLDFSTGPIRIKMTIRYRDYKRFGAESKLIP